LGVSIQAEAARVLIFAAAAATVGVRVTSEEFTGSAVKGKKLGRPFSLD
jgi:hypothetical protein